MKAKFAPSLEVCEKITLLDTWLNTLRNQFNLSAVMPDFFTPSRWFGVSRPLVPLPKSLTKVCEIIGGLRPSRSRKCCKITHVCDSSDSVTHCYEHDYGVGKTYVCYPHSPIENQHLWNSRSTICHLTNTF
jgi:hypothetical protein